MGLGVGAQLRVAGLDVAERVVLAHVSDACDGGGEELVMMARRS